MSDTAQFLAFDLGASGGRALLGRWDGTRLDMEEIHRFENGPIDVIGNLHWDALRLWAEIKAGLARYAALHTTPLVSIGIDTWAVDYALLDAKGRMLGNPYNYRDPRTNGMVDLVCAKVPRAEIFAETGIQFMQINTIYQLASMVQIGDPQLAAAETLLMMPDLFHYWLTGRRAAEYTNATSTQLFSCHHRRWATELAERIGIPSRLLPEVVGPGTLLGPLLASIVAETGLRNTPAVIVPATHDTASAVAAVPDLDASSAYISSGTWSLMGVEVPEPIVSARALALNFTNAVSYTHLTLPTNREV